MAFLCISVLRETRVEYPFKSCEQAGCHGLSQMLFTIANHGRLSNQMCWPAIFHIHDCSSRHNPLTRFFFSCYPCHFSLHPLPRACIAEQHISATCQLRSSLSSNRTACRRFAATSQLAPSIIDGSELRPNRKLLETSAGSHRLSDDIALTSDDRRQTSDYRTLGGCVNQRLSSATG